MHLLRFYHSYLIFFSLILSSPGLAITVHPSCNDFDIHGNVANEIINAFRIAPQVARIARLTLEKYKDKRISNRYERTRIDRLMKAFAVEPGEIYHKRVVDGLIDSVRKISRVDVARSSLKVYCGVPEDVFTKTWTDPETGKPWYKPDKTETYRWLWKDGNDQRWFARGAGLCDEVQYRAITDRYNNYQKGKFMIICALAFNPRVSFPLTKDEQSLDREALPFPENTLQHYLWSIPGVVHHELHHSEVEGTQDVPLDPPEVYDDGFSLDTAYQVTGVIELSWRHWDNNRKYGYELLYQNAESVAAMAIGIYLNGNSWEKNKARPYPGPGL